jgi:hypothetical protein
VRRRVRLGPVAGGDAGAGGVTSTLILDCTNCRDPERAGEPWRQADGLREWVADFDDDGQPFDKREMYCPECGAPGRVWRY